jgi:sterol desaturase/sphingolipid hydroxylase (fatty acid hydroxylase superfamily)
VPGSVVGEFGFVEAIRENRYAAAAVWLAALWAAEGIAPMFRGRRRRLSHAVANLGLGAVNGLLALVAAKGFLLVTEWSRAHGVGLTHRLGLSGAAAWAAALLLLDAWQYWWHRLNHAVPFLWRFHAVHHADRDLDASSGVRFHAVEIGLSWAARMAVLPLLGVTIPQLAVYETASLMVVLFHHGNLRVPEEADRALRWLIVTPRMHWVHHSRLRVETDSNYSSFLSAWDRIFGSFRLRRRPERIRLGLDGWREREWRSLDGLLAAPFRRP